MKRILHIEDDRDTVLLVKTLLERHGYSVSNAFNGNECLNILKEERIDLVLLDIMLPDMSGWDILHRIRRDPRNRDTKVVFLSVIPISEDRLRALKEDGVSDYIMKPFDNEDLIDRINKVLK